jgi:hypothetical protein
VTRLFLRFWNAPGLILIVIAAVAVQTALFSSYPLMYLQPDIVLLIEIWCALRREFLEGGVITIIAANIAEVHSGSPRGLFMCCYMAVYLSLRFSSRYFLVEKLTTLINLTLFSSIMWKLFGLLILSTLGLSDNQWRHTLVLLLPGAAIEGSMGVFVYRWLERYDWLTYKDPRRRKSLDDELSLDEEGL